MSSVVCIENKNYFLQNPLHGVNDGTHNKEGTCTTVAMQMLMGYHNYYSDRRLIPEVFGNTRFLHQDYSDFYYDPIKYNGEYYGRLYGFPQIGTEHAFYERLLRYIQISSELNNQTIPAVVNAANSIVNDYSPQIKSNVSISSSDGVAEIDAGRPILFRYNPIASDAANFHAVVAFGYARYNAELGFLIHSGWYDVFLFYWVPSRWIGFQIRMNVNHTHTYERTEKYYGAYSEFVCSECGSKKYDIYYTTNSTGQILTGVKYPLIETITIPSKINGKYITEIAPGALANKEMTTVEFENDSKINESPPSEWINGWNNNRPVVWNCTLSDDNSYVVSFAKSATNPSNSDVTNGISNPIRFGNTFDGWYSWRWDKTDG